MHAQITNLHTDPLQDHFATIPQHVAGDHSDTDGLTVEPCDTGDAVAVALIPAVAVLVLGTVVVQALRSVGLL